MKARRNHPIEAKMTIPEILSQLERYTGVFPRAALKEAIEQREAITPELLRILEEARANLEAIAQDEEYMALFFAVYLLAQFREERAYPLLVAFCSADQKLVHRLMGDVTTEDLDRILASVCHGDTSLIEQMVENRELDEYVRAAALESWIVLFTEGEKSRDEVIAYFRGLFHGRLERDFNFAWDNLVLCSCKLYPAELMPEIKQAYADRLVEPAFLSAHNVMDYLAAGEAATLAKLKNDPRHHFIGDTVKELESWASFRETEASPMPGQFPEFAPAPVRTGPKIGRNEPCTCGSGKKYKKCCGK